MHRVDNATAAVALPAPTAAGPKPDGFYTAGDPAGGIPATVVEAEHLNMIQEEIANLIENAGLELNKADNTQLGQAVAAMIAALATSSPDLAHTDLGAGPNLALDGTGDRSLKFIMTGATTVVPASIPADMLVAFVIHLHQDGVGGHAITLPAGTTWPYGEVPIWPSAALGNCKFMLATVNGGASWYASWMGADYA